MYSPLALGVIAVKHGALVAACDGHVTIRETAARRNRRVGMTPPAPIAYVRCTRPTLLPMPAPAAARLGVWPRHPHHPLIRLDSFGHIAAWLWLPTDDLFALVRHFIEDGTLMPVSGACARALYRPSRQCWEEVRLR